VMTPSRTPTAVISTHRATLRPPPLLNMAHGNTGRCAATAPAEPAWSFSITMGIRGETVRPLDAWGLCLVRASPQRPRGSKRPE
jgi:hypothetical protein